MRLNDPLITSFLYEDTEYNIDMAFDNVLDVFDILQDGLLRPFEKIEINLELLLGEQDYNPSVELWNYIYDNLIIKDTKKQVRYDLAGNPMPPKNDDERVIDLEQDAKFIYASFKQAYNINIFDEQGKMHWDIFQALLDGLPSNTIMQNIIQIRKWKPSKGDSSERKREMKELQDVYALRDETSEGVDELSSKK